MDGWWLDGWVEKTQTPPSYEYFVRRYSQYHGMDPQLGGQSGERAKKAKKAKSGQKCALSSCVRSKVGRQGGCAKVLR
jgi:hypothetical protein